MIRKKHICNFYRYSHNFDFKDSIIEIIFDYELYSLKAEVLLQLPKFIKSNL